MADVQDVRQKVFLKWFQETQVKRSSNATNAIQILVWTISNYQL